MPWTIGGRSRSERKVEKGSANLKGAGAGRISAKECPGGFPGWYIVLFLYLNHQITIFNLQIAKPIRFPDFHLVAQGDSATVRMSQNNFASLNRFPIFGLGLDHQSGSVLHIQ